MSHRNLYRGLDTQRAEVSRTFLVEYPRLREMASRQSHSEVARLEREQRFHLARYTKYMTQEPEAHIWLAPLNPADNRRIKDEIQARIDSLAAQVEESELDLQVAAGEATYLELPTHIAPSIFQVESGDTW